MAAAFGMHVRFNAITGQGDALAGVLLEAAGALAAVEACQLYIVSRSPDDEDVLWVTEAWTDRDAHAASLENEHTRTMIDQAIPLIAGPPEATELRVVGGKGLTRHRG